MTSYLDFSPSTLQYTLTTLIERDDRVSKPYHNPPSPYRAGFSEEAIVELCLHEVPITCVKVKENPQISLSIHVPRKRALYWSDV